MAHIMRPLKAKQTHAFAMLDQVAEHSEGFVLIAKMLIVSREKGFIVAIRLEPFPKRTGRAERFDMLVPYPILRHGF